MSADNVLATLVCSDTARMSVIPMIWIGEEERIFDPFFKQLFMFGSAFSTETDANAAEDSILDALYEQGRPPEYGETMAEWQRSMEDFNTRRE